MNRLTCAVFVIAVAISIDTAKAKPADESVYPRLQVGLGSHRVESPAGTRQATPSIILSGGMPIYERWRGDLWLLISPDNNRSSRRVRVEEDRITLAPLAGWSFPYLFRYHVAAGPTLSHFRTKIKLDNDIERFSTTQLGFMIMGGLDYAFNDYFELSGSASIIERLDDKKRDFLFALQVGYIFHPRTKTRQDTYDY